MSTTGVYRGVYVCNTCNFHCTRPGHLARHYQCSGHGPQRPVDARFLKKRHSYSFGSKRNYILELDNLRADTSVVSPLKLLSQRTGISSSNFSKWEKARAKNFLLARTRGLAKLRKYVPSQGKYPAAEQVLYGLFVWRRAYQRLRTSRDWLREQMRRAVLELHGVDVSFKASSGWCSAFCRRWEITYQCRTNKHKKAVEDRLPQIRRFHTWLIYGLQRSLPERCAKYGRFPPWLMYHMDQVPLPFSPGSKKTLHMKGTQCTMVEPGGSGATMRFCSLQVCICAQADNQDVDLELIFRVGGTNLSQREWDHYASLKNIGVHFQAKAWAHHKYSLEWMERFRAQTLGKGEVLLGMDNHGPQKTPLVRAFMSAMGIVPAYTPADCTDCVSPVDHHVGQAIKTKIAQRYRDTFEADRDKWELPKKEGGLSDSRKRMLVATWTSEAWDEFCRENKSCITAAFVNTGFLIAKDGSENHKIELWPKRSGRSGSVGPTGQTYSF